VLLWVVGVGALLAAYFAHYNPELTMVRTLESVVFASAMPWLCAVKVRSARCGVVA
jgi:hypothetical protein